MAFLAPMLATRGEPPTGPGWAFEFKWDGFRAIAEVAGGQLRLYSRDGNEITGTYPEVGVLTELLGDRPVILDGELVALDDQGTPQLARIQRRHQATPRPALLATFPVSYYVFDVLDLDGKPVRRQPYDTRRELLRQLGLKDPRNRVKVPPSFTAPAVDGLMLLDVARVHGLEGIVAKRRDSRYVPGKRSPAWIKTKVATTQS